MESRTQHRLAELVNRHKVRSCPASRRIFPNEELKAAARAIAHQHAVYEMNREPPEATCEADAIVLTARDGARMLLLEILQKVPGILDSYVISCRERGTRVLGEEWPGANTEIGKRLRNKVGNGFEAGLC